MKKILFSFFALGVFFLFVNSTLALSLPRELQIGMSGNDVTALQRFLASDRSIYPEGTISGYFGQLTRNAVARFQARFGVASVGRVGPQTLAYLRTLGDLMSGNTTNDPAKAPRISNVSVQIYGNSATITWSTDELANGHIFYDNKQLVTTEYDNSVGVSGIQANNDNGNRTSQSITLNNLSPGTTYYYLIYVTDTDGNVSVTWPTTFRTN